MIPLNLTDLPFCQCFFFQFITKLQVKPSYFVLVDNTKSCDRVLEVEVWVKRTKVRLLDVSKEASTDDPEPDKGFSK